MPTYIQLLPKFKFDKKARTIWMQVNEGLFSLTVRNYDVVFSLDQPNGVTLKAVCAQGELYGSMPPHNPYEDSNDPTGALKKRREEQFDREFSTDPEKMERGVVMTNIYNHASYRLEGGGGNPGNLDLKAGTVLKYTPFPAQLPDFSVRLTLAAE